MNSMYLFVWFQGFTFSKTIRPFNCNMINKTGLNVNITIKNKNTNMNINIIEFTKTHNCKILFNKWNTRKSVLSRSNWRLAHCEQQRPPSTTMPRRNTVLLSKYTPRDNRTSHAQNVCLDFDHSNSNINIIVLWYPIICTSFIFV